RRSVRLCSTGWWRGCTSTARPSTRRRTSRSTTSSTRPTPAGGSRTRSPPPLRRPHPTAASALASTRGDDGGLAASPEYIAPGFRGVCTRVGGGGPPLGRFAAHQTTLGVSSDEVRPVLRAATAEAGRGRVVGPRRRAAHLPRDAGAGRAGRPSRLRLRLRGRAPLPRG